MFQATGAEGRLLLSYAVAARLGAWSCSTGLELGSDTSVSAALRWQHQIYIAGRPLTLGLRFGAHEWRWQVRYLQVQDDRLQVKAMGAPVVVAWQQTE